MQASGTAPLAYQWLKAGVPISTATNSLYPLTLSSASAGTYSVVITNTAGSVTSSVANVTVLDTTAPTITSSPGNQTSHANASCQATVPDLRGGVVAADCSGSVTIGQSPAPGTVVGLGVTNITLTATDVSNNVSSVAVTLTVLDVTPPVVSSSPTNRTVAANSTCQATLPDLRSEMIATDCSGSVTITQSPQPGTTTVGLGNTIITLTAVDSNLNATNRTATITVVDVTPPTLVSFPANQDIAADTNCQAVIPNLTNSVLATDCGSGVIVSQFPAPGTVVGLVATNITLTATDAANNSTNVIVTINVQDVTPPNILTCATNLTIALGNFATTTLPDLRGQIVATDCGSGVTVSQSPALGTIIGIGATAVTLFAYDAAGNTNTCTATVTCTATPPSILMPPGNVVTAPGGSATFTVGALGTPPFTYQWQLNGTNIAGANGSTYTVPNASGTNAGSYTVVVCNATNCVTSAAGSLTVMGLDLYPGLLIYGPVGANYRVDYSEDLGSPTNWTIITNFTLPANPYLFPDPTPARQIKRFYRAVKQ